jgi:hypothetical protein
MMKKCIWLLFCFAWDISSGQDNLVPNGGFEEFNNCPISSAWVVQDVPYWNDNNLNYGTPDYFNACDSTKIYGVPYNCVGFQFAKQGVAYVNINCFNFSSPNTPREYLFCKLKSPLYQRAKYLISFWVSPVDNRQFAVNRLGALLTVFPPVYTQTEGLFNYNPQIVNNGILNPLGDTALWTLVSDTFQSMIGGEEFISIGNFFKDEESDTFSIGDGIHFVSVASYYIDDVSVIELDSTTGITEKEFSNLTIYPNPAQNTIAFKNKAPVSVSIYSLSGALLLSKSIQKDEEIDISALANGVYSVAIGNKREKLVVCR